VHAVYDREHNRGVTKQIFVLNHSVRGFWFGFVLFLTELLNELFSVTGSATLTMDLL